METSQPNAVLAYDKDYETDLWIDREKFDPEIHSEYEPQDLVEDMVQYCKLEDLLANPHEHLRKALNFPATWDHQKNSFYLACFEHLAEKVLDEFLSDDLSDEVKSVILMRVGLK